MAQYIKKLASGGTADEPELQVRTLYGNYDAERLLANLDNPHNEEVFLNQFTRRKDREHAMAAYTAVKLAVADGSLHQDKDTRWYGNGISDDRFIGYAINFTKLIYNLMTPIKRNNTTTDSTKEEEKAKTKFNADSEFGKYFALTIFGGDKLTSQMKLDWQLQDDIDPNNRKVRSNTNRLAWLKEYLPKYRDYLNESTTDYDWGIHKNKESYIAKLDKAIQDLNTIGSEYGETEQNTLKSIFNNLGMAGNRKLFDVTNISGESELSLRLLDIDPQDADDIRFENWLKQPENQQWVGEPRARQVYEAWRQLSLQSTLDLITSLLNLQAWNEELDRIFNSPFLELRVMSLNIKDNIELPDSVEEQTNYIQTLKNKFKNAFNNLLQFKLLAHIDDPRTLREFQTLLRIYIYDTDHGKESPLKKINDNEYLFNDSFNPEDGTIVKFNKETQQAVLVRIDKELLKEFLKLMKQHFYKKNNFNYVESNKIGGILKNIKKFQEPNLPIKLENTDYNKVFKAEDDQTQQTDNTTVTKNKLKVNASEPGFPILEKVIPALEGVRERTPELILAGSKKIDFGSMNVHDITRLATASADLMSVFGGPPTMMAVAAGTTIADLANDLSDPAVSPGLAWSNFGLNAALTLGSAGGTKVIKAIPKLRAAAKPFKAALLAIAASMATSAESAAIESFKKFFNTNEKLTSDDLRYIANGISILMGGIKNYKENKQVKTLTQETTNEVLLNNKLKIKVSNDLLNALKSAADKEARGKIISEIIGSTDGLNVPDIAYDFTPGHGWRWPIQFKKPIFQNPLPTSDKAPIVTTTRTNVEVPYLESIFGKRYSNVYNRFLRWIHGARLEYRNVDDVFETVLKDEFGKRRFSNLEKEIIDQHLSKKGQKIDWDAYDAEFSKLPKYDDFQIENDAYLVFDPYTQKVISIPRDQKLKIINNGYYPPSLALLEAYHATPESVLNLYSGKESHKLSKNKTNDIYEGLKELSDARGKSRLNPIILDNTADLWIQIRDDKGNIIPLYVKGTVNLKAQIEALPTLELKLRILQKWSGVSQGFAQGGKLERLLALKKNGGIVKALPGAVLTADNLKDEDWAWYRNRYPQLELGDWTAQLPRHLLADDQFNLQQQHNLDQTLKNAFLKNQAYTSNHDIVGKDINEYFKWLLEQDPNKQWTIDEFMQNYNDMLHGIRGFWQNKHYNEYSGTTNHVANDKNNATETHNTNYPLIYSNRSNTDSLEAYNIGYSDKLKRWMGSSTWMRRADQYKDEYENLKTNEEKLHRIHFVNGLGWVYKKANGDIAQITEADKTLLGLQADGTIKTPQSLQTPTPATEGEKPGQQGTKQEGAKQQLQKLGVGSGAISGIPGRSGKWKEWIKNFPDFRPEILDIARLMANLRGNSKMYDLAKQLRTPLKNPMVAHRNVYTGFDIELAANQQANQLLANAGLAKTSDASINEAIAQEAQYKGLNIAREGQLKSDQILRDTAEKQWAVDREVDRYNLGVADFNNAALHELYNQEIKAHMGKIRSNVDSITNYLMAEASILKLNRDKLRDERERYTDKAEEAWLAHLIANDETVRSARQNWLNKSRTPGVSWPELYLAQYQYQDAQLAATWKYTLEYLKNKGVDISHYENNQPRVVKKGGTLDDTQVKKRSKDNDRLIKQIIAGLRENSKALDRLSKALLLSIRSILK